MPATNLFDYLTWRGDILWNGAPFGKIDGMILARFAYAPFQLTILGNRSNYASLKEITDALLQFPTIRSNLLDPEDLNLFSALGDAARFSSLQIGNVWNVFDPIEETQFSANTIFLNDHLACLCFRGTDNTLVGWKESINLGVTCPIASQTLALEYTEDFTENWSGDILLLGHSKGGNLASYAAISCSPQCQKKSVPPAQPVACVSPYKGKLPALESKDPSNVRQPHHQLLAKPLGPISSNCFVLPALP